MINIFIMQTEKAREGALSAVGDFDKTKLKKSETDVKNPLPSSEAIAQELEHIKFKVKPNQIHATFSHFLRKKNIYGNFFSAKLKVSF